jgi:uncharacterized phage protein (TIGR01671 family)
MSRVLKFRVWHISSHCMIPLLHLSWEYEQLYVLLSDETGDFLCNANQVEIMQFTGQLDKQGKEIYESDIVKDDLGIVGIVTWETVVGFFIRNLRREDGYCYVLHDHWEIIGNIWEHPHLLKSEELQS